MATYPSPPAPRPLAANALWTADMVLVVASSVARGQSLRSATVRLGRRFEPTEWSQSTDPFWAWALDVWRIAEASVVGDAEERLAQVGLGNEEASPAGIKALDRVVSSRSDIYQPTQTDQGGRGSVHVTVETLQVLLQGRAPTDLTTQVYLDGDALQRLPAPPTPALDVAPGLLKRHAPAKTDT